MLVHTWQKYGGGRHSHLSQPMVSLTYPYLHFKSGQEAVQSKIMEKKNTV